MNELSDANIQNLKQSLRDLKKLFVIKETGFPIQLITQFVTTNELFEKVIEDYYWSHYKDQEVPLEGQFGTVITELANTGVLSTLHVLELFDQYTTASLLATPRWFESQPEELPFLQECIEKIPSFHASMLDFLKIIQHQD